MHIHVDTAGDATFSKQTMHEFFGSPIKVLKSC